MDNIKNTARLLIISKIIIVILVLCFTLANSVYCSDLVKYSLCDIQVLYIFEDQSEIDWPVIYYLNDNYGCRIDLLTIIKKASTMLPVMIHHQ
ncbi:MAG: hypothetical protein ACE5D6_01180 [Candidatus Zixiibacteriota bacterium]